MTGPEGRGRVAIPPGRVSAVRGRFQAPALTWVTRAVIAAGIASAVLPGDAGRAVATAVVAAVVATPLVRVTWLVLRWWHEGDRPFMGAGIVLLGIIAAGAALAAYGVGS